jgi:YggT family protein
LVPAQDKHMAMELNAVIHLLFQVLYYLLLARVILSWVPSEPGDSLFDIHVWLYNLTEPLCYPFRQLIPPMGGFDFSIIFVFIGLQIFESQLFSFLGG